MLHSKLCISLYQKKITFHHVYKHQDKNKREEALTLAGRLTIRVNALLENTTTIQNNTNILNSQIVIYINNKY